MTGKEEKIIAIWDKLCNLTKKEEKAITQDIEKRYEKLGDINDVDVMTLLIAVDGVWDEAQRVGKLELLSELAQGLKDKEQELKALKVAKEL